MWPFKSKLFTPKMTVEDYVDVLRRDLLEGMAKETLLPKKTTYTCKECKHVVELPPAKTIKRSERYVDNETYCKLCIPPYDSVKVEYNYGGFIISDIKYFKNVECDIEGKVLK